MCKKIKKCFYAPLTFEKILKAHLRARKHKTYKKELIHFEINLENNITNLLNNIKSKTYRIRKYHTFTIYEPKERIIKALPYVDRIVHQWYVEEFIKPYIVPKFIFSTFACLENKGTHKAVEQVNKYMQICKKNFNNFWILKCDIKKFFYSINPNILFQILGKYIEDKDFLDFSHLIIFSNQDETLGIPIGNYTSQYFANIYLNELDQYVKRVLKIKYYTRYMDDFVLILKNKEDCIKAKNQIEVFLKSNLQLELNNKSKYYPDKMGVNFCGYRIFTTHKLLRNSSKKKIMKNVKKWNSQYKNGNLNFQKCIASLNSWTGHISHCNSHNLYKKVINSCDFIVNDRTSEKIYNEMLEFYNNN